MITVLIILLQVFILLCSFILEDFIYNANGSFDLNLEYAVKIIILIILSIITEIHHPKLYQKKFKYVISPYIKFTFLFLLVNIIIDFISGNFFFHYYIILASLLLVSNGFLIFYLLKKNVSSQIISEISKYSQNELKIDDNLSLGKISNKLINKVNLYPKEVLDEYDLLFNSDSNCQVAVYDITMVKSSSLNDILICDIFINSIKNLNNILSELYSSIKNGGALIICYEDLEDYEKRFISNSRSFIKFIKLFYYYIFKRLLPKLPVLNKVSILFNNSYKVISKAEVWGRLAYNGFDVIKEIKKNSKTYICAKKSLEKSTNPNPSYYPFIKLNRVGLQGKIIQIHKLRSMYPYSEFIQKKVFENNNLNNIGKFEDDFRITKPGKYFRKYWLDELPQFYDWLRGEIKLVGIRAMSQHFFSLYPKEYKDLYLTVKPGIISPIFDEKTAGFKEIVEVEKKYLLSYIKNPIITDMKYFFITFKDIIKGKRSK